jgi:AraC family transcriptional regulator
MTLKDYIRSRKLSSSLVLLRKTNLTIADIAKRHQYDYEQSYSRSFKKQFGISPKFYRDNPIEVEITPKMELSFLIDLKDSVIIEPKFVMIPSFELAGTLHTVTIEEKFNYKPSKLANDFFENDRLKIKKPVKENVFYGYTFKHPKADHTYYLTSLEVDDKSEYPDHFEKVNVYESKYIVFKFIGSFHASQITWEHLKEIWSVRDDYLTHYQDIEEKPLGYFEYIDGSISNEDYCEIEIYVPIV